MVDLQVEMAVMLLVEVARVEHNLQVVALDLFQLMELQGLHFKVDLVPVAAEADTSEVAGVVDTLVVVLMEQVVVDLLILDHHF